MGDGPPRHRHGPLITAEHRDRVAGHVAAGAESGATVVVDGREADVPRTGFFLGTTLLDRVTPDMSVYTDEIFGPVLCVVRAETYDEALAVVNGNPYANGTAIFTATAVRPGGSSSTWRSAWSASTCRSRAGGLLLVRRLEGLLFGDTHVRPRGSLLPRGKVVTSRWPDPATSQVDLGFPGPADPPAVTRRRTARGCTLLHMRSQLVTSWWPAD